jgi:hypothetical protein
MFSMNLAHEIRSGDRWGAVTTTPNDADFHFIILEHHPAERRWRATVSAGPDRPTPVAATLSVGAERVEHFAFQPSAWRTNAFVQFKVSFDPRARR